MRFKVLEKVGPDVKCKCTDPRILLPCANLTVWRDGHMAREKSATLPTISSKVFFNLPKIYLIFSSFASFLEHRRCRSVRLCYHFT